MVVGLEPANARRAMEALGTLDYRPRAPVPAADFADPLIRRGTVFSLWSPRFPATEVDVFVVEPMPIAELSRKASRVMLGTSPVSVASIEDLVAMKEKVGRPKDLQDVAELRKLLAMRSSGP